MKEKVPNHLVSQIFKLNLETRIITPNRTTAVPLIMKGPYKSDGVKVLLDMGKKNLLGTENMLIEFKGKVDIEYLKYSGEVEVKPISGEPGYYKMKVISLYKVNQREFKRVPYRRAIKIIEPIECDGVLINISGSGAMLNTVEEIDSDNLTLTFTLLKQKLVLKADIIEQTYNPDLNCYCLRCQFIDVDKKSQKIIQQAVKEIVLMAKRRLMS